MDSLMDLFNFGNRILLSLRDLLLIIIQFLDYELFDGFSVFEVMFGSALITYLLIRIVI